jgi:hypothetical protein
VGLRPTRLKVNSLLLSRYSASLREPPPHRLRPEGRRTTTTIYYCYCMHVHSL